MISESCNGAKFENIKSSKKTMVHRQDSSATICFLCLRNFHEAKILPCNHIFCLECIIPFLNPLNLLSCPKCKKEHLILQVHYITTALKSEKMLLPTYIDSKNICTIFHREIYHNWNLWNQKLHHKLWIVHTALRNMKRTKYVFIVKKHIVYNVLPHMFLNSKVNQEKYWNN